MSTNDPQVLAALKIAREAEQKDALWQEAMLELIGAVPKGLAGIAYDGKPNPKKLASLLLDGQQPPIMVLRAIGRALLPSKERGHLKLNVKAPPKTKSRAAIISDFVTRLKAKELVETYRNDHTEQRAVGRAAVELNKTESWIRETLRMNDEELFSSFLSGKRPRVKKRSTKK
jgi:hypothetical protein